MGSKRHSCNCIECVESREIRSTLQHGGMDYEQDETILVPYRKKRRKMYKNRNKACAKSKTGDPCDFSVYIEKHGWLSRDGWYRYWMVKTCSRCGKYGQGSYNNIRRPRIGDAPHEQI